MYESDPDIFLKGQTAQELDFYRIREKVAGCALTEEGKELLLKRESTSDKQTVLRLKSLGRQWSIYLNSRFAQTLHAWPPVKEAFSLLHTEGSCLSCGQLFAAGIFCTCSQNTAQAILSAAKEIEIPGLAEIASSLPSLESARKEIFSVIDSATGEVRDLPRLAAIRSRIASLKKEISCALKKYTSSPKLSEALQSTVPAFRSDRELLAVRTDHRSKIKGIIHEASDSGQTLYIEPEEAVRANNELVQEEYAFQSELKKIFRELTDKLRPFSGDLESCRESLLLLDTTHAAAQYQKETGGIFSQECSLENEPPAILCARHPLLGERAVPVTMKFASGKNMLIITGPNTGGKTVTLKTVALFALMNQAGFPVPAAEGTRLPVFDAVFADIGDEQSIDESLSTFSGRMKKIARALNYASSQSLVLLDELGSGTDPLEGSAIAMAVLDSLLEKNAFVLVTTHHGALKNYGYTNQKCINASVEFSPETMRPTYRLLTGIPGESHAIDIARSSGLPEETVKKAQSYIATEQADISVLIKGLSKKHEELDTLIQEQSRREEELARKEHSLLSKEAEILKREIALKEAEHSQSSAFLRETRSRLENLVRVLREGEITREKTLGVRNFISGLTDEITQQEKTLETQKDTLQKTQALLLEEEERITQNGMRLSSLREQSHASGKKTKKRLSNAQALKNAAAWQSDCKGKGSSGALPSDAFLTEGTEVLAGPEKRRGILVRRAKDGIWQVQFGALKMNVPQHLLSPAATNQAPGKQPVPVTIEKNSDSAEKNADVPKFELRLLGMRHEEALKALEHQLDLCIIHGFKNFSVIHGKGNGILQNAVHSYLSHYPGIKDFRFARPEEGGSGKTYVELL